MNNKSNRMKKDDDLKKLFAGTKVKASENLKYRIMQQIETEQALSHKKSKSRPVLGSMLSIFGIMYALIAAIGIGVYTSAGSGALMSGTFILPVVFISSVCGLYWLITIFDDRRRVKNK